MIRNFEVTLKDISVSGELVFSAEGCDYRLLAAEGTAGETPGLPSSLEQWSLQIGLRGCLSFTWHVSTEAPALFSFCSYPDQSLVRARLLDDVPTASRHRLLGWKSFNQPAGFLAKDPSLVGRT